MNVTLTDGSCHIIYKINTKFIHKIHRIDIIETNLNFSKQRIKHICYIEVVCINFGFNKIRKIPDISAFEAFINNNRIKSCKTKFSIHRGIENDNKIKDWSYAVFYNSFPPNKYIEK